MNLQVACVNPTQDEMKAMGFKAEKAPDYNHPEYGFRVNFYLKGTIGEQDFHIPHSIFLKDEYVKTNDGTKFQSMDKYGRSAFLTNAEIKAKKSPYDWFDGASLRGAKKGESNLYDFLSALCNPKKGQEFKLESIEKLIAGDLSELKQALKAAANNYIKCLVGVKDGKYMIVYSYKFERAYANTLSYLHKDFAKNVQYTEQRNEYYGPIDHMLFNPNDFKVRPFEDNSATAATSTSNNAVDAFNAASKDSEVGGAGFNFKDDEDDDLPF